PELGFVVQPGGIFDRFANAIPQITANLQAITPKIVAFVDSIVRNKDTVIAAIGGLAAAFVAAKLAAIGLAIASSPVSALFFVIAAAVTALIGVIAFLQIKFDIFGKLVNALRPVLEIIGGVFKDLWGNIVDLARVIGKELAPVFQFVSEHAKVFKGILL